MDWLEIILRVGVATFAGAVIGFERELRHKAAGLRTHMLVALGSAAIMIVAVQMDESASRVVQGVVTGIGFIGAGAILHSQGRTEGVTTASSIWACTMMGMAAGGGYFKVTIVTLAFALFILVGCLAIERSLQAKKGREATPIPRQKGHETDR
jgi:putative Mg2+ transporter-C (MgtC) family protein